MPKNNMSGVHINTEEAIRFAEELEDQAKRVLKIVEATTSEFDNLATIWQDNHIKPFEEHRIKATQMLEDFAKKSINYSKHLCYAAKRLEEDYKRLKL